MADGDAAMTEPTPEPVSPASGQPFGGPYLHIYEGPSVLGPAQAVLNRLNAWRLEDGELVDSEEVYTEVLSIIYSYPLLREQDPTLCSEVVKAVARGGFISFPGVKIPCWAHRTARRGEIMGCPTSGTMGVTCAKKPSASGRCSVAA
jgi:hypothetical protein